MSATGTTPGMAAVPVGVRVAHGFGRPTVPRHAPVPAPNELDETVPSPSAEGRGRGEIAARPAEVYVAS